VAVTPDNLRTKSTFDRTSHPDERQAEAAFERLFEAHYARIYGVMFRLLGDRAEAEDLTLEAFWRLYRQPPRSSQNIGGWLYRVATRLGLNALRALRRRQGYEQQAGRLEVSRSPGLDPEEAAMAREQQARVRQAIGRLPDKQAQLLVLRYSGLSYREIAEAVGVAPGSVGTLLARAEREFEKVYRADGPVE
jgi:RNA polymerase sigma-70 factor, ECF subfamily